jgi:exonuclease SbcD
MRILHTSDWHLGKTLKTFAREDEQLAQVEHICQLTSEHDVDVMLVAGDIFDARSKQLPTLTKRLAEILKPRLEAGLHVILLPGNHDDREHFHMMYTLLNLDEEVQTRLYVVRTQMVFEIKGVLFGMVPYPNRDVLEASYADTAGGTQRNVSLSARFADIVRYIANQLEGQVQPAVFATHVVVAGVTTPSEHEISYASDLRLGRQDLPVTGNLAYIALGHIHQSQQIDHAVPCYYSGSLDRMDRGERNDAKSVLIVDVPSFGPAKVESIPLPATPFYDLDLTAADVDGLSDRYADLDRAFVQVNLTCGESDDVVALQRKIRQHCPRCLDLAVTYPEASSVAITKIDRPEDYVGTSLQYLKEVRGQDDDFEELKSRALDLIQEVTNAH